MSYFQELFGTKKNSHRWWKMKSCIKIDCVLLLEITYTVCSGKSHCGCSLTCIVSPQIHQLFLYFWQSNYSKSVFCSMKPHFHAKKKKLNQEWLYRITSLKCADCTWVLNNWILTENRIGWPSFKITVSLSRPSGRSTESLSLKRIHPASVHRVRGIGERSIDPAALSRVSKHLPGDPTPLLSPFTDCSLSM